MISVVVPTRNNESTIVELLESLARQTVRDFEVIVADSSSDRTPEIASRYPFVRVVSVPPAGINVARNAGLSAAKGEIIAFTDGDCRVPPDWLESIKRFFEEHPDAAAVGGSVLTAREIARSTAALYYNEALRPMMTIYARELEITVRNFHKARVPNGNNMAFKRRVLQGNPFDESIRGGYDEVELLWRLCEAGYRVYASPLIKVEHFHTGGWRRMLRRAFSYGRGHTMFFLKHSRAPLALYGMLGALALYTYYALAALLAVVGVYLPLLLPLLAYLALATVYLVKGRGFRSFVYPLFDTSFYSTMAAGMLYELVRRARVGKGFSRTV